MSFQLSSLQRSIARWENTARRTVPSERYQLCPRVPFVRLQLLLAPIVELCLGLQDTAQLRACLGALRCDTYRLAGRIAFETRGDAAARLCR
ncbi:MAG: hypothetical protein ACRDRG_19030 [Pseudonocardiaceae bacterium]